VFILQATEFYFAETKEDDDFNLSIGTEADIMVDLEVVLLYFRTQQCFFLLWIFFLIFFKAVSF
jgi:hypothetical protein